MHSSLVDHLVDFRASEEPGKRRFGTQFDDLLSMTRVRAAVAAASAEGERLGAARVEREVEERLAAAARAAATELAAARETWINEAGDALCRRFDAATSQIADRIAAAAALVLLPLVRAQHRAATLDAFVGAVQEVLSNRNAVRLDMTGPAELLEAVVDRLDGQRLHVTTHAAAQVDIVAQIDDALVRVRFEQFALGLMEEACGQ